ncbi:MAG: FtsQ-type POTRA domain-containing protein [Candidatus Hydrogenedentes bacterium]|nr:FtsQ-type POTRA domain-containing protein [Candidatus Hydrogenedentota bacterium]
MARAAALRPMHGGYTRRSGRHSLRTVFTAIAFASASGAAANGLYQYVFVSGYFQLNSVQVVGAHLLNADRIVEASGVSSEDNVIFIRSGVVADRVEAMPYVKSCTVTRTLPDMVTISIEERYPIATLLVHNHPYEVDAEMNVLRRLNVAEPHTGPLISQVADVGAVEPGMQLAQPPLRVAIEVWQAFAETSMARDVTVSEIAAVGTNDIRMYCDELQFEIRWGRDDVVQQARNLDVLWQQRGADLPCTSYLDLRFGQDLACK